MTARTHRTDVVELLDVDPALPPPGRLDRQTTIAAIVITAFFWATNFGIQMWRSKLDRLPDLGNLSIARGIGILFGITICFGIHLIIQSLRRQPFWLRVVVLILVVPPAADACAWVTYLLNGHFAPASIVAWPSSSATIQAIVYWCWFLLAWGALYLALCYNMEVQASERRARRIQGLAHTAQMRALHNQINPHFMFNTLNSISALILDGEQAASEQMVTRLADFLRATLAVDPLTDIALAEELRIQRLYLDIEQIRFPDLRVSFSCDDDAMTLLVPPLILQPVIENAVKHGVAARQGQNEIALTARCVGDRLELTVRNVRAIPTGKHGLGLGLQNVAARLAAHYGPGNFAFAAAPEGDRDYRVSVSLPRQDMI